MKRQVRQVKVDHCTGGGDGKIKQVRKKKGKGEKQKGEMNESKTWKEKR